MKKSLLAFLLLGAVGCNPAGSGKPYYVTGKGKPDNCVCRFQYKDGYANWIDFHDSCHLYHIGDTIK